MSKAKGKGKGFAAAMARAKAAKAAAGPAGHTVATAKVAAFVNAAAAANGHAPGVYSTQKNGQL